MAIANIAMAAGSLVRPLLVVLAAALSAQAPIRAPQQQQQQQQQQPGNLLFDPVRFKAGALARRLIRGDTATAASADATEGVQGVLLLDVENIRGKSGFGWDHVDFLKALGMWMSVCGLQDAVVAVVDHGNDPSAFYLEDLKMSVIFAGRSQRADDSIAQDLLEGYFWNKQHHQDQQINATTERTKNATSDFLHAMVVTADQGLIYRCKRIQKFLWQSSAMLEILCPSLLLQDLSKIASTWSVADTNEKVTSSDKGQSNITFSPYLVKLGGELLEVERILQVRFGPLQRKNKERTKLKKQAQTLREKLASPAFTSFAQRSANKGSVQRNPTQTISSTAVLNCVDKILQRANRREDKLNIGNSNSLTFALVPFDDKERIVEAASNHVEVALMMRLMEEFEKRFKKGAPVGRTSRIEKAENLRQYLMEQYPTGQSIRSLRQLIKSKLGLFDSSPALHYVMNANAMRSDLVELPVNRPKGSLRLVVISDTHGFEKSLPPLPEGDILLHLGDFAPFHFELGPTTYTRNKRRTGNKDENTKRNREAFSHQMDQALGDFDAWLEKQNFSMKIVLRGNHDPKHWEPRLSGATFITKPTTLTIGGFDGATSYTVTCIPYGRADGEHGRCDILMSHEPPRGILDQNLRGKSTGNKGLRKSVEKMTAGPPVLWACGHIHEGRGIARHKFCHDAETTVVNVANANIGRATKVDHGPVLFELEEDERNQRRKKVEILEMSGQYTHMNFRSYEFFSRPRAEGVQQMLLAVDLGLRTGLSLYNQKGRLVRFKDFLFQSADDLENTAARLLAQWERDANAQIGEEFGGEEARWALTHVAIEGADLKLREAWVRAINLHGEQSLQQPVVLNVQPDEWRSDLLTEKEKMTGESAKAASRVIAQQIVADFGDFLHEGIFSTDAAESLLLGLHISRRLGWINRQPSIRRCSKGMPCVENLTLQTVVV